ncbi:hypothetical protein [Mycolicibacterium sediminis]|uniref:Uncharacterized protein n=1 Tax=Mycolicibacterium sediminis TaxID=1286180 RepID=A0A7I7QZF4_9MYCO|nr:hypothetical protein [Mycolicibacterium sediminis]BBY31276.1 hypothetical protein MSEDJ_53720 [Mycolicibacterium sediminis]
MTRDELKAAGLKSTNTPYSGYQPIHILSLEPRGDGFRATVCTGEYSTYEGAPDKPGKYVSTTAVAKTGKLQYGDWQLVGIQRIELTDKVLDAAAAPGSPAGAQAGPMPAPSGDVFGPWSFTGSSGGLWGLSGEGESIDPPEIRKQCEDAMPDDAAARKAMATGFHDAPPPHGDPIPGWPAVRG